MRFIPPIVLAVISLAAKAALAQPFLPQCGPALDGQVSHSGCTCRQVAASQLSARPAGWRWSCDLLRGSDAPPAPADLPGRQQALPPGFVYAPQVGQSPSGLAQGGLTAISPTDGRAWHGY